MKRTAILILVLFSLAVAQQPVMNWGATANWAYGTNNATGTGSTQIFASAGTGLRNYVGSCQFLNTSTTGTYVELLDGSTAVTYVPVPSSTASTTGGAVVTFTPPIRGTAATAFNFAAGGSTTTMYVSCQEFTGP